MSVVDNLIERSTVRFAEAEHHDAAAVGKRRWAPSSAARDWRSKFGSTSFPGVMSSAAGAVARWIAPFLTVAAVAGMGFLADPVQGGPAPAIRLVDDANPLAGAAFYVNPTSAAMRAAQQPIRRVLS